MVVYGVVYIETHLSRFVMHEKKRNMSHMYV